MKLCYNCLKTKHNSFQCNNPGRCRLCGLKHHTLLCRGQSDVKGSNKSSGTGKAGNRSSNEKVSTQIINTEPVITTAINSNSKGNILPTAQMNIFHREKIVKCRALLDSGSQKTFILKAVVDKLNLEIVRSAALSVDGFGSRGSVQQYDFVNLDIKTNSEINTIEAIVCLLYTSPSPRDKRQSRMPSSA